MEYQRFPLMILLVFMAIGNIYGQQGPDSNEVATLKRLNSQVLIYFDRGEFQLAAEHGSRSVELATKMFGRRDVNTAISLYNYAEALAGAKKLNESIEIFKELVEIYAEVFPDDLARVSRVADRMATIMAVDGRYAEAEAYFLGNIERMEKKFGVRSIETLPYVHALTRFYVHNDRDGKADESFLRAYEILWTNKRVKYDGRETLDDERTCFTTFQLNGSERKESYRRFKESYRRIKAADPESEQAVANGRLAGGVVNGRAISLVRPRYPEAAARARIAGSAVVKVLINEDGRISNARQICGDPVFQTSVELAAVSSVFSVTTISGVPTKVSGVITYNFVR